MGLPATSSRSARAAARRSNLYVCSREGSIAVRVVSDLRDLERDRPTILTIGSFDGVHRGHQYLVTQVMDRARHRDSASMVLTFDPIPQVVLRPGSLQI